MLEIMVDCYLWMDFVWERRIMKHLEIDNCVRANAMYVNVFIDSK